MMKLFRKLLMVALMATAITTLAGCGNNKIKIGILQPVEHSALSKAREGFIAGLAENGYGEDKVEINYQNALGENASLVSMSSSLVRKSDLVLGIATGAAQQLVASGAEINFTKPILFTAVTDPVDAELVTSLSNPGSNVTGTSDMNPVEAQIALIKEVLPSAKKVGILYTASEQNSEVQAQMAKTAAEAAGLTVVIKTISQASEIAAATTNLAKQVDSIYIPTDNLLASNMTLVGPAANNEKTLLVCGESSMVTNGGHITLSIDYFELGKITGKMAAEILNGKATSTMNVPVYPLESCTIDINEDGLKAINVSLPQSIKDRMDK